MRNELSRGGVSVILVTRDVRVTSEFIGGLAQAERVIGVKSFGPIAVSSSIALSPSRPTAEMDMTSPAGSKRIALMPWLYDEDFAEPKLGHIIRRYDMRIGLNVHSAVPSLNSTVSG
jgi:hypothetical protein